MNRTRSRTVVMKKKRKKKRKERKDKEKKKKKKVERRGKKKRGERKLEKPEAAKLLNRKQYATLPTYQKKPASYEYYPRLPRLGAICNCSSPFPLLHLRSISPRRSLFLNLRLRNRTIPSLLHFCSRYISFHGSSFINLSFSPRIFHSPPSPADTCHSLSLLSPALSRLYRSFLSLWLAP